MHRHTALDGTRGVQVEVFEEDRHLQLGVHFAGDADSAAAVDGGASGVQVVRLGREQADDCLRLFGQE